MMRQQLSSAARLLALAAALATGAGATENDTGAAARTFERLKALAGNWEGRAPDGSPVAVKYEVTSGGSIVIESRQPANEPPMVSVFHLDHGRLMMTHYCSAGNHPRMRATRQGANSVRFQTFDVQNLRQPSGGHMRGLSVDFSPAGGGGMEQVWIWRDKGKDSESRFQLRRIEASLPARQ